MKHCVESEAELFAALRCHDELSDVVPTVLDMLERDPLASAGYFRGDLLRALIDLPAEFWGQNQRSFRRYQAVLRAGAIARRSLPSAERMAFWTDV